MSLTNQQNPPAARMLRVDCPGRAFLDRVTTKWGVLVLIALHERPHRFFELRDRVGGVSDKMLSQTLRTLCGDRLVDRSVEDSIPPKVTYSLTNVGHEFAGELDRLVGWVADNAERIGR